MPMCFCEICHKEKRSFMSAGVLSSVSGEEGLAIMTGIRWKLYKIAV